MKLIIGIYLIVFLSSCTEYRPKNTTNDKADMINEFISECNKQGLFSGSVLVTDNGRIIYKSSFGYSTIESGEINTIDTKFRIGSMTKQFTSMMIMQLIEEGKIKLNGKITDYLKEYRDDTGSKITIHHLLAHQSGIIDFCNYDQFWSDHAQNMNDDAFMIKKFHSNNTEFEPGTKVNYCNSGYCLLALIIENVTEMSYEENLVTRITRLLQMENTGVIITGAKTPNTAKGYINSFLGVEASFLEMTNFTGAGNMYSTIEDLYKWDQALYSNKILSKEYLKIMFTPNLEKYAYGWLVENIIDDEDTLVNTYHQGHINGFCSIISRIENTETTIILLHNGGVTKVYEMSEQIRNILLKGEYSIPKIPIDIRLSKEISKSEKNDLLVKYLQLKKDSLDYYDFEMYYLYAFIANHENIDNSNIIKQINEIIDYELR